MEFEYNLEKILVEDDDYPVGEGIEVVRGLTLTKTPTWWKAALLVKVRDKHQLRLYGWQLINNEYKVRQKFNISQGYSSKLSKILTAFATYSVKK